MLKKQDRPPIYGLMAEFHTPEELLAATERVRDAGYERYDAYSPFPVEGMDELVPSSGPYLPLLVLCGGLTGAAAGLGLQYYVSAIYYPINVGGRPYFSWPSFIPITFELTVLFSAFAAVFGMLALNKLPMPYHPVFNIKRFGAASNDRFFITVEARDPKFDPVKTRELLESTKPEFVMEVPH